MLIFLKRFIVTSAVVLSISYPQSVWSSQDCYDCSTQHDPTLDMQQYLLPVSNKARSVVACIDPSNFDVGFCKIYMYSQLYSNLDAWISKCKSQIPADKRTTLDLLTKVRCNGVPVNRKLISRNKSLNKVFALYNKIIRNISKSGNHNLKKFVRVLNTKVEGKTFLDNLHSIPPAVNSPSRSFVNLLKRITNNFCAKGAKFSKGKIPRGYKCKHNPKFTSSSI